MRQKRPRGYVCVTHKVKLLSSWPQKYCRHGSSRNFRATHACVWILGPSLWARKVLSCSLSFLSLFPYASKKKKCFHLCCSVDIGLNDILYAIEATCQWNIEAAQGKIRGFFPFARIVWQVGWRKARESQISGVGKLSPALGAICWRSSTISSRNILIDGIGSLSREIILDMLDREEFFQSPRAGSQHGWSPAMKGKGRFTMERCQQGQRDPHLFIGGNSQGPPRSILAGPPDPPYKSWTWISPWLHCFGREMTCCILCAFSPSKVLFWHLKATHATWKHRVHINLGLKRELPEKEPGAQNWTRSLPAS